MSDTSDICKALKEDDRQDRAANRKQAGGEYETARFYGATHGLLLIRRTDAHYQLSADGWQLNLYPGNQRIYRDKTRKTRAPFVRLDPTRCWTLTDVVEAALVAMGCIEMDSNNGGLDNE